jgi:hypothetical protein
VAAQDYRKRELQVGGYLIGKKRTIRNNKKNHTTS